MAKRRKFHPGRTLRAIEEVVEAFRDEQWLYWHDRPKHPRVIANMSLTTILGALNWGNLRFTVLNPPVYPVLPQGAPAWKRLLRPAPAICKCKESPRMGCSCYVCHEPDPRQRATCPAIPIWQRQQECWTRVLFPHKHSPMRMIVCTNMEEA